MWKHDEQGEFDAAVWKGQIDFTTATVRVGMMIGLGLIWLGLAVWFFFPG